MPLLINDFIEGNIVFVLKQYIGDIVEFKVNKEIIGEVQDVSNCGTKINEEYSEISSEGVNTLQTAISYIQQQKDIMEILELYKELVSKDTQDILDIIAEVEAMDCKLSLQSKIQ